MRRIPFAELERSLDEALVCIDAGETVIVTRDGRDTMKLVPIAQTPPDQSEIDLVG